MSDKRDDRRPPGISSPAEFEAGEMFHRTYARLRELAGFYFRHENPGHTLQPTALVHEAYLRLSKNERLRWRDRAHFLSFASRVMRQVLVDAARNKTYRKRGGGSHRVTLGELPAARLPEGSDVLDLDRALRELESLDRRKSEIVQMRFFGGMTAIETAQALGVSEATVHRHWRAARAWLGKRLAADWGQEAST